MILAMLGQSQPTTAAMTNITRKNRVRLAFIFSPRHRASEGRGRSFLFSSHLSAQREQQGQPSEQEEYNHRRPGVTKTANEVTEDTESDHDHKIQRIAVHAERA